MALPPLTGFEALYYKDSMDIYRAITWDENGDPLGYQLMYSNVPVNIHQTQNFDVRKSDAGMSKEVSLLTSDRHTCQLPVDLQSLDACFFTTRFGAQYWRIADGAAKKGSLMPHTFFYGVPCVEPVIYVPPNAPLQFLLPPIIPRVIPQFGLFQGLW